jgi:alpha-L-fucosidase
MQNGSEWYLLRLLESGTYRPMSGWKETQQFHKENYGDKTYADFVNDFKCEKFDPEKWMKTAKMIGAEYVILTAKHHDGFCLWNTKTTNFNSKDNEPKRDLLKEFKDSAINNGLKFGIYYSWCGALGTNVDTHGSKSVTIDYFEKTISPQVKELMKYKPSIWFFDGDWGIKSKFVREHINKLIDEIHSTKSLVNDRICLDSENISDINYLGKSDYRVYSDRYIPEQKPNVKWYHINTIGLSWGYNKMQEKEDYKSGSDLYELYTKIKKKNGDFMINIGPKSDGTLDPYEEESLKTFGMLLKKEKTKKKIISKRK